MEKLKQKNKHDHLFTKILKVSIFALVMLAPMFAVAAKCMYVTFNKNAKESYYGETINEQLTQNVDSNNFQNNNQYTFTFNRNDDFYYTGVMLVNNVNIISYSNPSELDNIPIDDIYQIYLDFRVVRFYYTNNDYFSINIAYRTGIISFYLENSSNITQGFLQHLTITTYNDYSYIDNVFYYSVEQIGNEQIFSWTKNTGIYGAINTMTTGLGIDPTNNILAVLLTYWSLITAVYIIIDIVIEMFVKLTHLLA